MNNFELQKSAIFRCLKHQSIMEALNIINKYYSENEELRDLLVRHSEDVTNLAVKIANEHPELDVDVDFVREAAMLHDIGIFRTNAPGIHCYGTEPYICHGILGADLLREEGLPRHARVAERHTGAGITAADVIRQQLPLPVADYLPETMEEKLICYADKFFSKSHPDHMKTLEGARRSLRKFGDETQERFELMVRMFQSVD